MTTAPLEQRYRRLLACYPADHRSTYEEEMIGVLLAAAGSGQRRPGVAETLDLIGGAGRIRLSVPAALASLCLPPLDRLPGIRGWRGKPGGDTPRVVRDC